jgi:hypothetical protein
LTQAFNLYRAAALIIAPGRDIATHKLIDAVGNHDPLGTEHGSNDLNLAGRPILPLVDQHMIEAKQVRLTHAKIGHLLIGDVASLKQLGKCPGTRAIFSEEILILAQQVEALQHPANQRHHGFHPGSRPDRPILAPRSAPSTPQIRCKGFFELYFNAIKARGFHASQ